LVCRQTETGYGRFEEKDDHYFTVRERACGVGSDRIREEYKMTRSQALREALRRYLAAMRSLPALEEPSPDELEALREAEEEFARGGGRGLRAVLHDAPTLPSPACGGGLGRGQPG
jgi:hypothetical protein